MACRQSGSLTGHEMSSTQAWMMVDFCGARRPWTISVGRGEEGRERASIEVASPVSLGVSGTAAGTVGLSDLDLV